MEIKIRKACINDIEDILRLNLFLFEKEIKEYDKSLNLNWNRLQGKDYFKDKVIQKEAFLVVAEASGEIIGYLCGGISEKISYRKAGEYAELENMAVNDKFQRNGIGTRLVEEFLKWCKRNRIDYISVTASAKNIQAINFYRKMGFKDYNLTLEIQKNLEKENQIFIPRLGQIDYTNARWAPVINCILRYKDKILVVQRSKKLNFYPGYWNGISGFLDDGKTLKEKVFEEIKEETGINKRDVAKIRLGEIFDQEEQEYKKTWIVHPVLVEIKTNEIKLDWEAKEYKWATLKEVQKLKLLPGFKEVLEKLSKWIA